MIFLMMFSGLAVAQNGDVGDEAEEEVEEAEELAETMVWWIIRRIQGLGSLLILAGLTFDGLKFWEAGNNPSKRKEVKNSAIMKIGALGALLVLPEIGRTFIDEFFV